MERWVGKVAVVTGASAGIGAQIAVDLANAGMIVVGLARRVNRVEELKSKISSNSTGILHAFKCDITNEDNVKEVFKWIVANLGGVDVLINNAGIFRMGNLIDTDTTVSIREVIDTNIMGVVLCTREAFQSMKSRNFNGHIFIINSAAGHIVPNHPEVGSFNIYSPTKFAVTAMTEVYRQEFLSEGTGVKITSISPGAVQTDIAKMSGHPMLIEAFKSHAILRTEDVSQAVIYALSTKPLVQVHDMIIQPIILPQ